MSELLLHNACLIDPAKRREFSGSLEIAKGRISRIVPQDAEDMHATLSTGKVVDCLGMCLAPGLIDIGVKIGEPGERHKESFRSAGLAAAAGGVTTIVMRADTLPAIDTPETLRFVLDRAREEAPVHVHPLAALTKGRAGREMTEIGFLRDAGALGFSDGDAVCADPRVMARALGYARQSGALVIGHVQDPGLSRGAAVTSGKFAALRGLRAVSPMAERMGLERDLALCEMTGASYHADQITTAAALAPLRRAKEAGLDVTAGVSIHHLTLNELDVGDYRTFFKVKPPLRSDDDRRAVVAALAEGLIDIICSMHTPQDEESKRLPYGEAASGAVGLET
ncbi:MAG: dihydroorotase, partial [Paracoccaceae bacterium]